MMPMVTDKYNDMTLAGDGTLGNAQTMLHPACMHMSAQNAAVMHTNLKSVSRTDFAC